MNLLKPKTTEEQIISILQDKPMAAMKILELMQKNGHQLTKQAIYSSLRKMKADEIIVVHGGLISLGHVWVTKMAKFFDTARKKYLKETFLDEGFLNLEDGDKVIYNFKNIKTADAFWGNAFALLANNTSRKIPLVLYNPHEWILIARHDTERALFNEVMGIPRQIFLVAGHNDSIDKIIIDDFDGKMGQHHMLSEPAFQDESYYLNIFDDFVIETWIDKDIAVKINNFYKTEKSLSKNNISELQAITRDIGMNKIKISRNKKRADKLRVKFEKYFYKLDLI